MIVDANYLGISEEAGVTLDGGPVARDLDVDVETEQSVVNLLLGYLIASGTTAAERTYSFDVQGGARYNNQRQEIDIAGSANTVSLGGSEHWWEPVIGARGACALNDTWSFAAGADASGFGAGSNNLAWSATAAFGWEFAEYSSLKFGYRYYSIDFETVHSDGTFGYEVRQHGPFVGVSFLLDWHLRHDLCLHANATYAGLSVLRHHLEAPSVHSTEHRRMPLEETQMRIVWSWTSHGLIDTYPEYPSGSNFTL